jgi:hypothetical protein
MNSTQEVLFIDLQQEWNDELLINQNNIEFQTVSFAQSCLCTPKRPTHSNCKSHKNPYCPYSCVYELPVGDGLLFMIALAFSYLSFKYLKNKI